MTTTPPDAQADPERRLFLEETRALQARLERRAAAARQAQAAGPARSIAQTLRRALPPAAGAGLRNAAKLARWIVTGRLAANLRARREFLSPVATPERYALWSKRFDTPDADALARISAEAYRLPPVTIGLRFDAASLGLADKTFAALNALVGVRWSVELGFDQSCPAQAVAVARRLARSLPQGRQDGALLYLEAGALPRPHGPWVLLKALHGEDVQLAYGDEDMLDSRGRPSMPWCKPQASRLLIEQDALLGRMVALKAGPGLLERLLDPGADARAALRGLALALPPGGVAHAPHVVAHNALPLPAPRPLRQAPPGSGAAPLVSLIIPTRDRWDLLGRCLASLDLSRWPRERMEVLVIDNGSVEVQTLEGLRAEETAGRIRVLRDDAPFNFPRLINAGARAARGEILLLLNNDTEVLDPDWIGKLAAHAIRPDVGAVGAKLLYPDGTVQHAGVVCGLNGGAGHPYVGLAAGDGGYFGLATLTRDILAVTGACLAVRREAFAAVGGLDEDFRVAFNDVVFCMDLHRLGLRNVLVADPLLIHHESKSRGLDDTPAKIALQRREAARAWRRHPGLMASDPSYSPSLALDFAYKLSPAPRRRPAWSASPKAPFTVLILADGLGAGEDGAAIVRGQARALTAAGHRALVAGPAAADDIAFPEGGRLAVGDAAAAAALALERGAHLVIAHGPLFHGVVRWLGGAVPVMAIDYGEPPPRFAADEQARRDRLADKEASLRMCALVLAAAALVPPLPAAPPGATHREARRARVRAARGWQDSFVVLNASRFDLGQRVVRGIDLYAATAAALGGAQPGLAARTVFVLAGKGDAEDVADLASSGLAVISSPSDEDLADLYAAADAYADLARWTACGLGLARALALGLPVVASDACARDGGELRRVSGPEEAAQALGDVARTPPRDRPVAQGLELAEFVASVERLCAESEPASRA